MFKACLAKTMGRVLTFLAFLTVISIGAFAAMQPTLLKLIPERLLLQTL